MTPLIHNFLGACGFIIAITLAIYVGYLWKEYQHDKAAYEKERSDRIAQSALDHINHESSKELLDDINKDFGSKS